MMVGSKEPVSSRCNKIGADMESQRLWQHVQDEYRFKPDRVTALRVELTQGDILNPEVSVIGSHWQRENLSSLMEFHCEFQPHSREDPTPSCS